MKTFSQALFALYLLILLWLVLFKFSLDFSAVLAYHIRSLNVIPFANFSPSNARGWIYNVAVFIPFGLLLSVNLKRLTFGQQLALICLFSLDVELIQFIFAIGVTDITDVITNTLGGLLGLLLYNVSNAHVDEEKLDQIIVVAGTMLLVSFVLLLGLVLSAGVRFHSPPHKTASGNLDDISGHSFAYVSDANAARQATSP